MAHKQVTDDYYEILEISHDADEASIKRSYRRLALKHHPDKNPGNEKDATIKFHLIEAAYSTLSNPEERREYDLKYPSILRGRRVRGGYQAWSSAPGMFEDQELCEIRQRIAQFDKVIRDCQETRQRSASELFQAQRQLGDTQSILREVDEEEKKDAAPTGWFEFLFKNINHDVFVEKHRKKQRMRERIAVRKLQRPKLTILESSIQRIQSKISTLDAEIARAQAAKARETQNEKVREGVGRARQQHERQAAEESRNNAAQRARREQEQKTACQAERERQRERQEAARRAELMREVERKRLAEEADRARDEAERRRRQALYERINKTAMKEERETARKESRNEPTGWQSKDKGSPPVGTKGRSQQRSGQDGHGEACLHGRWWPKIIGQFRCKRCCDWTHRYAFQCPSCSVVACADCRNAMKG